MTSAPTFFEDAPAWRAWLAEHHDSERELLVGFWKKGRGRASMDWPQSVDEALCYGWIDGIRRRIDDDAYTIRFTPRRPASIWSQRNMERVAALAAEGRMRPAGLAAWHGRTGKEGIYAFGQGVDPPGFDEEQKARFGDAWQFFADQPDGYRRQMIWWVRSAKRPETQLRRLDAVVAASALGRRVEPSRPFAATD